MNFEVAVIGNGILGSLLSYHLSKYKINSCLIGSVNRPGSASTAAGAMINVFGEVDFWEKGTDYQDQKIKLGIESTKKWKEISDNYFNKEIMTADDTVIYLSKNSTNLEKNCFKLIKQITSDNLGSNLNIRQTKKIEFLKKTKVNNFAKEFFIIKNEGALDTKILFQHLDEALFKSKYIKIHNDIALNISKHSQNFKINTKSGSISAKKIIVCNGAFLNNLNLNLLPMFFGVGSALEFNNQNCFNFLPKRTVIRTPNRGSTCGIHIVPRSKNNFYVGAGSYLSKKPVHGHRVGTIDYLFNCLQNEFTGKLPHSPVNFVQGFRPISMDGKPLIGKLQNDENIFIASGTKRDGLTYAPILAEHILDCFIFNKNKRPFAHLFENWEPFRKPISYLKRNTAIKAYVDNKIAGLLEHGSVKNRSHEKKILKDLNEEAEKFHDKIQKKLKLDSDFGIHPELLNIL